MDPYRTLAADDVAEAPRDPGIVGDVIRQFADPHAFYRELVQNAIDAGTPTVEIRLDYDQAERVMHVIVRDRGEGMTRDVIENQLLVLFRSTKERDRTKIGKFGIGFASVLAPNPNVVVVQTAQGGQRLTLHLYRDLTYELFDAGPATQTGTTVELAIAMPPEQVAAFIDASNAALVRWCRHAQVPIELGYVSPAGAAIAQRIDRPLALDRALIECAGRSEDGLLVAIVGLTRHAAPYVGFFNHGLMLYETSEPLVGRCAVKLQDSRLGHTLSRDNVRRDLSFDRAIAFARSLASRDLPARAAAALQSAATAHDHVRYRALAGSLVTAEIALPASSWWVPLVEPIGELVAITADKLGRTAWSSPRGSALTALLAQGGVPIVRVEDDDRAGFAAHLATLAGCRLVEVDHELTCVTPIAMTETDHALVGNLGELLGVVRRPPSQIVLAQLAGACGDAFAIGGGVPAPDGSAYVVDRDAASHSPFGRRRRPPLVLSASHPRLRGARTGDPWLAASHLARAVLLQYQLLDVAASTALLAHTLARLGIAGASP